MFYMQRLNYSFIHSQLIFSTSSSSLVVSSASVTSFAGYRNGSYEMLPDLKGDEIKAKQKRVIILKINERKNGVFSVVSTLCASKL